MQCIAGKDTIEAKYPKILYDESRFTKGIPEKIYFPESREDIIETIINNDIYRKLL